MLQSLVPFVGVQPYCIVDKQVYLLIGKESSNGTWCGFGGSPDVIIDLSHPYWYPKVVTEALREYSEETMGILPVSYNQLKNIPYIVSNNNACIFMYPMYNIDYNIEEYYRNVYNHFNKHRCDAILTSLEKSDIKWVPFTQLLNYKLRPEYYKDLPLYKEYFTQVQR